MQLRSTHLGGLVLICFVNFTGLIDFIIIYLLQLNTKRNILVANVMHMQLKDKYKVLMWFKTIFIDVKCIKNLDIFRWSKQGNGIDSSKSLKSKRKVK